MDGSAALLTDPSKVTFTYVDQLPYFKIAWDELQEALVINGITDVDENMTTAATIAALAVEYTAAPTDMLFPIKLWERAVGGAEEDWIRMEEDRPDPADPMETELEVWYFAEGLVKFRGATEIREIIMRYQRSLTAIVSENTVLPIHAVKPFLMFRTAAIIAQTRGNKGRAADLDKDALMHYNNLIGAKVKDMQGDPVRPRRYGYTRRMLRMTRLI